MLKAAKDAVGRVSAYVGSSITGKKSRMVSLVRQIPDMHLEWRNRPSIYKWTRQNGILSQEEHERWLERIRTDRSTLMFGIKEGTEFIGCAGLTSISNDHGSAEFSLFIAPEHQKNGYGKDALIKLLRYGFKNLRLNSIWGETFEGNSALKLFKDLGMTEDGLLRKRYFKNGEYIDAHLISILIEEAKCQPWWNTSKPSQS
jgi:RimJ/RimL family protein N-acetyltransferase